MRLGPAIIFLFIFAARISPLGWTSEPESDYHIVSWQIEDGLPQNSVRMITQTVDGYLWLATLNGGLARFDGRNFRTYNRSEIPGLHAASITCLYGDQVGRLWIGAEDQLLSFSGGQFTTYPQPSGSKLGQYVGVAEDKSGTLYALTWHGLLRIDPDERQLIRIPNPNKPNGGVKMAADAQGRVWIASGNTLRRFHNGEWAVAATFDSIISSLLAGNDETIWCGMNGGAVARVESQGAPTFFHFGEGTIFGILEGDPGRLLIRMGHEILRFPEGDAMRLSLPNGKAIDRIQDIYRDREENLWVATDGDGLLLLRRKPLRTVSVEQGLSNRHVSTIAEDTHGRIWIGTMIGGPAIFDGTQCRSIEFPEGHGIGALLGTRNGALWIGTHGRHLWRLSDPDGIPQLETRSRALAGRALFEDKNGNIWIGGDGLGVECIQGDKVVRFDTRHGLMTDQTRCFAEDRSGAIWVGTDRGVYRISNGQVTSAFLAGEGLEENAINALFTDSEGTLWVGTDGGGLSRYRDSKFETITKRDGLPDNVIFQILEDDDGHLWLGTHRGLFRVRRTDLHQVLDGIIPAVNGRVFGKAEGMRNLECSGGFQPNCIKDKEGRLWFATVDGVTVVDPKNLPINRVAPPVHIERFVADGVDLPDGETPVVCLASGLPGSNGRMASAGDGERTRQMIYVPAGAKRLEFYYTGINFSSVERVRFKYKLEGYDRDWNEAAQSMAAYTRLPPGEYTFRVQAANGDGVWNPAFAELPFAVLPEFWQTWWFRGSAGLVLGGLVFAFSYGPIHRRRQMERLRLRIARDLHDEVGSNLGTIALYSQLAQAKESEHESSISDFQEIDRVVQRTAQSLRDAIWFINPEFDTLSGMLQHMEDAANRTLVGKSVVFQSDGSLHSQRLGVEFRRNMFLVFRELVHNILKHSQARRVHISVSQKNKWLVLQVTDDGVGFDLGSAKTGHGLNNIKQRSAELGGKFEMTSAPGAGTQSRVTVPLT